MATTNNNKIETHHHLHDGEPLRKRARFNEHNSNQNNDDVCIDLKSCLMSQYNTEIASSSLINKNIISSQTDNTGDSGFQDFTSSSSSSSNDSPCQTTTNDIDNFNPHHLQDLNNNNNENENSIEQVKKEEVVEEEEENDEDNQSFTNSFKFLSDFDDDEADDLEYSQPQKWQSNFGPLSWLQQQMFASHTNPRSIIDDLIPNNFIPSNVNNLTLWKLIENLLSEPPRREKLPHINNLEDVVDLIKKSKKIIVLTGAGVSVSSGIPDFRSRDGIYARLSVDFPDLPDPQAMFDINYFRKDQRPFFKFAKEIYPGQFKPSISHKFIKLIENHGKLLRNYTQNIDTLEKSANIERVITCHGSFSTASCTNCKFKVDGSLIKDDIFAQTVPRCPKCPPDCKELCVMKPDIVFFHESLTDEFHNAMAEDKNECDLLIVIGSSLKVKPVALIPTSIPADVPQILINREHLSHCVFDVELLGDCDVIVQELCHRLGDSWNSICVNEKLKEIKQEKLNFTDILPDDSYVCVRPARYLFKGAEISNDSSDSSDDDDEDENDSSNDDEDNSSNSNNSGLNQKPNQLNSLPSPTSSVQK